MSEASFKDKLIEAAKAKAAQDQANRPQLPKKTGCIVVVVILLLFITVGFFIGRSFFFDGKGFEIKELSFASPAQVSIVESVVNEGYHINSDHCVTCWAKYGFNRDHGECYLFGTRLSGDQGEERVIYLLVVGPKDQPNKVFSYGYEQLPFVQCEPCWPESSKNSQTHYKAYFGSGISNITRYFNTNFDIPDKKPRGLLWGLYGLGKNKELPR